MAGQVEGDRDEIGVGTGRVRRVEPLVELVEVDPALARGLAEHLRHLVAVLVGDPQLRRVRRVHGAQPNPRPGTGPMLQRHHDVAQDGLVDAVLETAVGLGVDRLEAGVGEHGAGLRPRARAHVDRDPDRATRTQHRHPARHGRREQVERAALQRRRPTGCRAARRTARR